LLFRTTKPDLFNLCSHLNGQLHHIAPGRLLAFPPPINGLPPGQEWADADGRRAFGPAFYADLFAHLGVAAVVRIGADPASGSTADSATGGTAFAAAGLPVSDVPLLSETEAGGDEAPESLHTDAAPASSPAMLDRLAALMDAVPGLVALQLPTDDAGARALVAAYIARRSRPPALPRSPTERLLQSEEVWAGLEGDEAAAWLHMALPCTAAGGWHAGS